MGCLVCNGDLLSINHTADESQLSISFGYSLHRPDRYLRLAYDQDEIALFIPEVDNFLVEDHEKANRQFTDAEFGRLENHYFRSADL